MPDAPTTRLLRHGIACACLPFTQSANMLFPGLRILMYHRVAELECFDQLTVTPARFEQQMQRLAQGTQVLSLSESLNRLAVGSRNRPTVAVTFDDGYLDNLHHALPILERYQVPATIFITTDFCDQNHSHPRYAASADRLHLNWQEVRQLAAHPLITIGSHTMTHPYLPTLTAELATQEIVDSRQIIEHQLGAGIEFFCYPSGDFGPREVELVAHAGYRAAVSVAPGLNRRGTDRYTLRRTEITDKDDAFEMWLKLHGAFDPAHRLLHLRRQRRFAAQAARLQHTGST